MAPVPWTAEKMAKTKAKVDKEARRAAMRLGAKAAVMIVFYEDGEYLHFIDGGVSPIPGRDLYLKMISIIDINAQTGGEGVKIQ